MTEIQKIVIRNISNEFNNKEKLEAICKEYKEIYGSELKDDYTKWRDGFKRIYNMKGNN